MKPTKNLLALKIFYLGSALFWTLLIAVSCLVSFSKLPNLGVAGADKYAHITFYFGFTVLWFLYLDVAWPNLRRPLLKIAAASVLYGIAIEIAQQLFTATRQGDGKDVVANTAGTIAAVALIFVYDSYQKRKYN